MEFPEISEKQRLSRLQLPDGKLDIVIDTDTYNEIDDQFALTYALLSPGRLQVEAIYAAPFQNERSTDPADGMEKSYVEILNVLAKLGKFQRDGFVFKGATGYLSKEINPFRSDASLDLVKRAIDRSEDDPLYVISIAALTNVASAILIEPSIIKKIVVVWLGGHALHWPDTAEFNLRQDTYAAGIALNSGVPLVLIPCMGVTSHLVTTLPEMREFVRGRGRIGDYLFDIFANYESNQFGWSKVIWDIAPIAYLLDPNWVPTELISSPILEELTWKIDNHRHIIRYARFIHRDPIFRDLFLKLEKANQPQKMIDSGG
jgi:hypothetical protein